jgi:hypothetical protein
VEATIVHFTFHGIYQVGNFLLIHLNEFSHWLHNPARAAHSLAASAMLGKPQYTSSAAAKICAAV